VYEDIAQACYLSPFNFSSLLLDFFRQRPGSLPDNLKVSHNSILGFAICGEGFKVHFVNKFPYP